MLISVGLGLELFARQHVMNGWSAVYDKRPQPTDFMDSFCDKKIYGHDFERIYRQL